MARPIKNGIDYFPLDVDIFSDEKMVPISVEFGIKGEIIVIRLLCAIYRNSYFIEWSELMRYKFAKEMPSVSSELLESVVERLVKWECFNREMFETYHVLTSEGIQRRYFSAIRKRSRRNTAKSPYLLIDIKDAQRTNEQPQQPRQPQLQPIPQTPAPKPQRVAGSNAEWLKEFFAEKHKENLLLLCKNFALGYGKIDVLRTLADAVVAEWELSNTTHTDYSDWSRHLISSMRIKSRDVRTDKPGNSSNSTPPAADDYTYGGGFGGQDV